MKKKEVRMITCIICPTGCKAKATIENGKITRIEDLECPRGEEYVTRELEAPVRDFFTTVRIKGAMFPVLPVRTTQPIPKDKILDYISELADVVVDAPVKVGDVIAKNLLGLGVDIVATRDLDRVKRTAQE
jgi:CxxC motif-containing protein